mmetsp:Transcript_16683/g.37022  ORF Transcript_16683/g.37022 Transcript_16683/m.37022 type:complete len:91 (+) Transcript_16683:683-955(+)
MHAVTYLHAAPALLHYHESTLARRSAPLEGQMLLDAVRFLDIFHCLGDCQRLEKATIVKMMQHVAQPPAWRTLILQWLSVKAQTSGKGEL